MKHKHPIAPHFYGDPTPPFALPNGLGTLVRAMPAADWCGGWVYRIEWADGIASPAMLACSANDIDVLLAGGTLTDAEARSIGDARVGAMLCDLRRLPLSEAVLMLALQRHNALALIDDEAATAKAIEAEESKVVERDTAYTPIHVLDTATSMFERVDQALTQAEEHLCNDRLKAVEELIEDHLVDVLGWIARIRAARRCIADADAMGEAKGNA